MAEQILSEQTSGHDVALVYAHGVMESGFKGQTVWTAFVERQQKQNILLLTPTAPEYLYHFRKTDKKKLEDPSCDAVMEEQKRVASPCFQYFPLDKRLKYDGCPGNENVREDYAGQAEKYNAAAQSVFIEQSAQYLLDEGYTGPVIFAGYSMGGTTGSALGHNLSDGPLADLLKQGCTFDIVLDAAGFAGDSAEGFPKNEWGDKVKFHIVRGNNDAIVPPLNSTVLAQAAIDAGYETHIVSGDWNHSHKDKGHFDRLQEHVQDIINGQQAYRNKPDVSTDPYVGLWENLKTRARSIIPAP